jgi:hypothetical protein
MTTPILTEAPTVRAVLFPAPNTEVGAAVGQHAKSAGVSAMLRNRTGHLSGAAQRELHHQVDGAAADLLNIDIGMLIINGWRKHLELTAAAKSTLAAPGTTKTVDLPSHRITSTHRPHVDVFLDGIRVARIELALDLTFDVVFAVAVVQDGSLAGVRAGRCELQATFAIEGYALPPRRKQISFDSWQILSARIPLCSAPAGESAPAA